MALLHEAVHFKKFDTRMVERNINRGVLTAQEYSELLKTLPDDAEVAEWVSVESLADDGASIEASQEPLANGKGTH
jgi:hypothetical protein